jgi:superfamily II DNA or RNA helicase/stalled ribosome alternative rescue factor ArfA
MLSSFFMDKEWREYEHHAIQYHQQTYEHTVWHNDVIPEEELMNAGFIHDFNRHRLCRIARKRESKGKAVKYNDYGMDFLSKDVNGNYHACQAKHYRKRKVVANDLGSFQSVVYCRIKNTGYLYTSGDIEINLKEDIMNSNGMLVHHNLPFHKGEVKQVATKNSINEPSYELRTYQRDAIEAILNQCDDVNNDSVYNIEDNTDDDSLGEENQHNRKVLELFCGGGKTIIAGHVLKRTSYDLILCIAPLRVSVEQLKTRLTPFIPSYEVLLVDSDEGGITDVDKVKYIIENRTKPMVIFSTFTSTENVLSHVITSFSHNMFLLVDEVHNILSKDKLCQFANRFHNSLLLSATIPEELYDVLDANKCFTYGISDAIKNGYCCDYEVFLPYIDMENNEIDITTPLELTKYDKSMSAKAMFLATGMLKTGSRRCIVYLASHEECDMFLEIAKIAFEEYHGIPFWGAKIDSTVSANKRRDIINEFQSCSNNSPFKIIASVRILDEAVDIPKCDSEFITVVGDQTSDIRTVQRLCRGCRLDTENRCKKNNLFMWCSDWSKAISCLTLLKDADPNFHRKIRTLSANYDNQGTQEGKERILVQEQQLHQYINVKCLSLDERWELRRQQWIQQYQQLGRKPSCKSKNDMERSAAYWQGDMRKAMRGKGERRLTEQQIEMLNNTEGWTWEEPDIFTEQYNNWIQQYKTLGRSPSAGSDNPDEKRAARWKETIRQIKRGKLTDRVLTDEQVELLNNTQGWAWEQPDTFSLQYEKWLIQYRKLGRKPSSKSKDEDELRAGIWQQTMRQAKKGKGSWKLTQQQTEILHNTEGWTWEQPDAFTTQYTMWVKHFNTFGRKPSNSAVNENERKIAHWQSDVRQSKKGKGSWKLTEEQLEILNNTIGWTWEKPDVFTEQYTNWVEQYSKLGRKPICTSKYELERKAGQWQSRVRQNRRGTGRGMITEQQIEILNNTEGWTWDG